MIELYMWNTDNGFKARQMVEETGLEHQIKPVLLPKKAQFEPEFLAISPAHKTPAIVDTDGPGGARITLFESGAILKYLAEKCASPLYPADPATRANVDQWFFFGSATFTTHAQQMGHFVTRYSIDVPEAKKYYVEQYLDMLGMYERHLGDNEYLAGDYSVADISTYPDIHLHKASGIDLADYPNVKRWHDAIEARPAVQRAWVPVE